MLHRTFVLGGALAALGFCLLGSVAFAEDKKEPPTKIVFVPTPDEVIDKMFEIAKVSKDDIVYDLGCGDGKVVVRAAKKFGCKGVGVDIDPPRIKESNENVKKAGVEKLVDIRLGNALDVKDFDRATVVTLYMLPDFMEKLEPIAKKRLKPGTRIISHDFTFPNWKADKEVEFMGPEREHNLYLWIVK
jgi:cyclopropane fatty-acyl-phospholipid synthase-like methyltransferase